VAHSAPMPIKNHRELVVYQREILQRLNAAPDIAALLLLNPVLALKEVGIQPSRSVAHHVLHTLQHPAALRQRREEIRQTLQKKLGENPQPNDPCWVRKFLFEILKLQPLNTQGLTPKYVEPLPLNGMEKLQALRPKQKTDRYPTVHSRGSSTVLAIAPFPTTARRMDLQADLPPLGPACDVPEQVTLEELYFYKDSHPWVQQVLELGILQRRAFPIQSSSSFRQIKRGERTNALHQWIASIRFPESSSINRRIEP